MSASPQAAEEREQFERAWAELEAHDYAESFSIFARIASTRTLAPSEPASWPHSAGRVRVAMVGE